ncbi:hypothetical protein DL96DRAFT_1610340 [Flagelloscypha sp. PMI_526]|nr:hypothetical protein DL96DRAFT_1610340 [Flagelloscypha sp. PMI_526]
MASSSTPRAPPTAYQFDLTAPRRLSTIPSEGEQSTSNGVTPSAPGAGRVSGDTNAARASAETGAGRASGDTTAGRSSGGYQTPAARYAKRKASDIESVSSDSPPRPSLLQQQPSRGSTSSGRAKGKTRFQITPDQAQSDPQQYPRQIRRTSTSSTAHSHHSHIPSSFRENKRARLSVPDPSSSSSAPPSRPSSPNGLPHRAKSKPPSLTSIPLSALISPHAPSLAPSATFHMRDPKKPRIRPTGWAVHVRGEGQEKPPVQCWLFLVGFICPVTWVVGGWVWGVPQTRRLSGDVVEEGRKGDGVLLDDPQIEHDARTWRLRCRWASFVALFTYLPFIIVVAYFGSRA